VLVASVECFVLLPRFHIVVMRLSTLGLVGAAFSFLCWGRGFLHPLASSSCTR
jgi:hypothetical protein